MDAIRQGIVTPTTKAALHKAEAERERFQAELRTQTSTCDKTSLLAPNLKARFESLVSNRASIRQKHIDQARAFLKTILGPENLLHPSSDGEERFLTAEMFRGTMRG